MRDARARAVAAERGGTTPFNLLPVAGRSALKTDANDHGAATPVDVCRWWIKYISPPGSTVLDPFVGSGTVALAAMKLGRNAIGIERMPKYHATATERVNAARAARAELIIPA